MIKEINVLKVPFFGTELLLVEHNDQPYVVMRNVVEGIGLAWQSQYEKITHKFKSSVTEIVTVAQDGKKRSMTCMKLRKFPAWLYTINPNKVSSERKERVIAYQEECDEVLWQYWTTGIATREQVKARLAEIDEFEKVSKQNGTNGSHLMHQRKKEIKEIERLRQGAYQLDLFKHFNVKV